MAKAFNSSKMALPLVIMQMLVLGIIIWNKYHLNNISLTEFNALTIGNLLNILLSTVYILGVVIATFIKKNSKRFLFQFLLLIEIITTILLLLPYYVDFFGFAENSAYLVGYPIKKVTLGAAVISAAVLQVFSVAILANYIIGVRKLLLLKSLSLSILIISGTIIYSFYYTTTFAPSKLSKNSKSSKTAVVFGAAVWNKNQPSPLFKGRINKAKELLLTGDINKIFLMGANAPGELSEAKAAYNYLINQGISKNKIEIEEETSTTSEQVFFIKDKLIFKNNSLVLVSDQFHLARINAMCNFYGINAETISSDYSLSWEKLLYYRFRDSIGLLLFWFYAI